MRDLASGPRRFVELQRVLPGISTEQLRSRLNRMVADGLLTRKRYREVPPRVDYELTERASELMPVLGALARWGYQWAWSAPRVSESVDVGAIFRLAPGALAGSRLTGVAELIVIDPEAAGERSTYTFAAGENGITVAERASERADVRISGTVGDWIAALSPEQNRGGLQISGDRMLAETLLDALVALPAQAVGATGAA